MKIFDQDGKRPWQGLLSGLALALCLSVPAGAFGSGGDYPRGDNGEGDDLGSYAGGDETVGTLPSSNTGSGGDTATDNVGAHNPWDQFFALGGSLTLEGSAVALMTTITSLHGEPRLDIEALEGGRQRWTISGDFDLGLDLNLLPGSGIAISVGTPIDALSDVRLRGRELGQRVLTAEQGLDLPLAAFVQSGQIPSGLTVTTVDGFGTATRLTVHRTRRGLLLSQRSVQID